MVTQELENTITREEFSSEADVLRNIVEWSKDRPAWQRDALRRLVIQGELTESDIDELYALCKDPNLTSDPLTEDHIGTQRSAAPTVALKNIRRVQNVNALAESQSLNFIPLGVTIVYGDNGAGKSGYVRILRKTCRARRVRGKSEQILPNVYQNSSTPQRAELEYEAGGQTQRSEWNNTEPAAELLSEISVFDSRTANVHVEETNDIAYTPYPMKLLKSLVDTCKIIKDKIDADIAVIKAQTPKSISAPSCSPNTTTGKLISSLNKDTNEDSVDALATLSEDELSRLTNVASDVAQDPKTAARKLLAQKTRLETLHATLNKLADAIEPANGDKLASLFKDLKIKSEAAKLAARDLSKVDPLGGVGSATWQKLWEAARAYSTGDAYPQQGFPVTSDKSRCVLCQQDLNQDAAQRLRSFEEFVQSKTQQEEIAAREAFEGFKFTLALTKISREQLIADKRFATDELGNADLATRISEFTTRAHWRIRAILRAKADVDHLNPTLPDVGLNKFIVELNSRAMALMAEDGSEERDKLRTELAELQDRRSLHSIKQDVIAEISRLKNISELETAVKDTRHSGITTKNTALSKALITNRLRARFAREIDHLNLAGLAIELTRERSKDGDSRFRISLIESASSNAGDILSEGEYRCVALAGFMAELATNDSSSGIIFDDPVSSLDHLHREAIAMRLAKEGLRRQVIVFTHDLPFLFLLRNACNNVESQNQKTEIALRQIQKRQNTPGYCKNEAPDKAQSATSRISTIRNHLGNTRIQYEQDPDGITWLTTARGLIDNLRQTWETAVEDAISPVLKTFSSKVNTKGFAQLTAITLEDAETMRTHYGQCSVMLHKTSEEINPAAPSPEEIEAETDALNTWVQSVMARQQSINLA